MSNLFGIRNGGKGPSPIGFGFGESKGGTPWPTETLERSGRVSIVGDGLHLQTVLVFSSCSAKINIRS